MIGPLSKFPLFNEGVSVYPPGYELHYSYTDVKGKQADRIHYILKFNQIMSNYSTPPENNADLMNYYLNMMSESLKKLSNN